MRGPGDLNWTGRSKQDNYLTRRLGQSHAIRERQPQARTSVNLQRFGGCCCPLPSVARAAKPAGSGISG